MSLKSFFLCWLAALPIFFAIDMLWLVVLARDFYQQVLGHLLGPVNWPAALTFYAMFIAGIVLFAVRPARQSGSVKAALIWGGAYGFFTYATYDLTNLATLDRWPVAVVVPDILWGIVLSGSVAALTYLATRRWSD